MKVNSSTSLNPDQRQTTVSRLPSAGIPVLDRESELAADIRTTVLVYYRGAKLGPPEIYGTSSDKKML